MGRMTFCAWPACAAGDVAHGYMITRHNLFYQLAHLFNNTCAFMAKYTREFNREVSMLA
jgi:hypothetical protein